MGKQLVVLSALLLAGNGGVVAFSAVSRSGPSFECKLFVLTEVLISKRVTTNSGEELLMVAGRGKELAPRALLDRIDGVVVNVAWPYGLDEMDKLVLETHVAFLHRSLPWDDHDFRSYLFGIFRRQDRRFVPLMVGGHSLAKVPPFWRINTLRYDKDKDVVVFDYSGGGHSALRFRQHWRLEGGRLVKEFEESCPKNPGVWEYRMRLVRDEGKPAGTGLGQPQPGDFRVDVPAWFHDKPDDSLAATRSRIGPKPVRIERNRQAGGGANPDPLPMTSRPEVGSPATFPLAAKRQEAQASPSAGGQSWSYLAIGLAAGLALGAAPAWLLLRRRSGG